MRVYIDAIASKQIRLYYTKFTPKIKTGQICIIHGYGESTDDYLRVLIVLYRWPNTLPNVGMLSTCLTCVDLAIQVDLESINLLPKFCSILKHLCELAVKEILPPS